MHASKLKPKESRSEYRITTVVYAENYKLKDCKSTKFKLSCSPKAEQRINIRKRKSDKVVFEHDPKQLE